MKTVFSGGYCVLFAVFVETTLAACRRLFAAFSSAAPASEGRVRAPRTPKQGGKRSLRKTAPQDLVFILPDPR